MTRGHWVALGLSTAIVNVYAALHGIAPIGMLVSALLVAFTVSHAQLHKEVHSLRLPQTLDPSVQSVARSRHESARHAEQTGDVAPPEGEVVWPSRQQRAVEVVPVGRLTLPFDAAATSRKPSSARIRKLQRQRQQNFWK